MPWTFAHPAILRPLRARLAPLYLYAAALGTLMPDLGYYLGELGRRFSSHSMSGIFQICLPFSWLFLLLSLVFAKPMLEVLPAPHRLCLLQLWAQITTSFRPSLRTFVAMSSCMVLGSFTHILWDSATHRNGYLVQLFGFHAMLGGIPIFRWLQHLSTVLGSLVLLMWYRKNYQVFAAQNPPQPAWNRELSALVAVLISIATIATLRSLQIVAALAPELQLRAFFFPAAVLAAQLTVLVWLALAGAYWLKRRIWP